MLSCTITHPVVCEPLVVHEASEHGPRDDGNVFVVFLFLIEKAHSGTKINERGENVSPEHLKLTLIFYLVIKERPHSSTTQEGPWILHPAVVRVSVDLRIKESWSALGWKGP